MISVDIKKFAIYKTEGDADCPWWLDYPVDWDADGHTGERHGTFAQAVEAFVSGLDRWCMTCNRGTAVTTDWGWECTACGSYDVAVGCVKP